MRIAVYPGSFDPITNGHLNIALRASKLFDKVILLIAINPNKKSRFTLEERKTLLKETFKDYPNIEIDAYDGLSVTYAKERGAVALIRGLRVVSDFEYEWILNAANHFVDNEIEMIFLMAPTNLNFISSSSIDELYHQNVDISPLVPECVVRMYNKKFNK